MPSITRVVIMAWQLFSICGPRRALPAARRVTLNHDQRDNNWLPAQIGVEHVERLVLGDLGMERRSISAVDHVARLR